MRKCVFSIFKKKKSQKWHHILGKMEKWGKIANNVTY